MIETTPEGYKLLVRTDGSKEFMIDSDRIEACIEYIRQNDIRFIGINSFLGYRKSDISFLHEVADFIEGITVPEVYPDISVLNSLHKLRTLGFADNKKTVIDLSNFPNLSSLACEFSKRILSLETCEQLRSLTLTRFKSTDRTLEELPRLASLTTLDLFIPNVASLLGIGKFPILRELTLFKASHLDDISALKNVKDTLKILEFDSCKRIGNYETLSEMKALNRLIIVNSAPIQSLSFVYALANLEFLSFVGTNLVDGDLSPVIGLNYVGFENKQHYSHRFEELIHLQKRGKS